MLKRRRKLKISLLCLIVILLVAMVFTPTLIKNYAINNSKELFGRQIGIGNLKYNYFSSTVKVIDFKMFENNDKDHFTTIDTLILNLEPLKLLTDKIEIEQLYIKGLMVRTVMQDSTFNFDDLLAFHSVPEDTTNIEDQEPLKYSISDIELKDSNFFFDNKSVGKETHIEDFSFVIPHIGWDQEEKSNADVKFNFKNGGYLQSALNVNPVNGEFDAQITVENLYLKPFYEYVAEYAEINDFNGVLNSTIQINGNTSNPAASQVSGQVDVSDFIMTDKTDKEFLKADMINAELKNIDYANSSYAFNTIEMTKPYIYFEMDSITNNFFTIFKLDDYMNFDVDPSASEDDIEQKEGQSVENVESSDLYYAINNLKVNSGIMDYSDNLTGERFDYHLNEITINSDSISSKSKWINIKSDMLLNNRGTLNSSLGINPNDYNNLNLNMVIENFLLSDINIYANYYTGHNIVLGDFYYYSKSRITNGEILSENQLLVKNVSVENSNSGIATLPLKFALFLLKDKNGDVNLNIPVRGNTSDPEVDIKKLIWTTLKNKITGAASDPIGPLAIMVDVDPADYRELVFEYTDTIPNENHYLKLDKLLEMETQKEGLKVKLEHQVDPKLQQEALAVAALGQQYLKDKKKDYLEDKKGFKKYIKKETKNDTISVKGAALLLMEDSVLSALSQSYNEALLRNISSYLKGKKPNTAIEVIPVNPQEPNNKTSENKLVINFDMLTVMADDGTTNEPEKAKPATDAKDK